MNWQHFFKLTVHKSNRGREEIFFEGQLKTPHTFAMQELIISRFDPLNLSSIEKKKLSLDLRKIIICHTLFETPAFRKMIKNLTTKILLSPEKDFVFSTSGGGIYLFIQLLNNTSLRHKNIVCYTSELPLPIMTVKSHTHVQFIYRPLSHSYLSDFSTLWKESELLKIFELKDFKASA